MSYTRGYRRTFKLAEMHGDDNPGHGESGKVAKIEAQYTDMAPSLERCDNCVHFNGMNACAKVKGTVRPEGWCMYHTPTSG